jgi:hypothetical protein
MQLSHIIKSGEENTENQAVKLSPLDTTATACALFLRMHREKLFLKNNQEKRISLHVSLRKWLAMICDKLPAPKRRRVT